MRRTAFLRTLPSIAPIPLVGGVREQVMELLAARPA
jgi:hypothetical protein